MTGLGSKEKRGKHTNSRNKGGGGPKHDINEFLIRNFYFLYEHIFRGLQADLTCPSNITIYKTETEVI